MAEEDRVSWGTGLNKLKLRVQGFPTQHNLPDVSFDTKHQTSVDIICPGHLSTFSTVPSARFQ